ncbi:VOC family protein [Tropicimonas sp. TH_r6]|uniref:VOC family protein n=1 Tax=Tropicimonas sp. TH_r6 TaxID=3082085 RepID=UPI00295307BB|nr:VOC family protein [Tropicimonas sp. TH_r6]MDV7141859.1 VOC family protein [Tropicimonas sp. TH_r6]
MQFLSAVTLVVPDYDAAIAFYCGKLGWALLEDIPQGSKRWVTIAPEGSQCRFVLGRAEGAAQKAAIGNQTGGRVAFFLSTDDFASDHAAMRAAGVRFREDPRHEPYGIVAVWEDPFGNSWDLIEPKG